MQSSEFVEDVVEVGVMGIWWLLLPLLDEDLDLFRFLGFLFLV